MTARVLLVIASASLLACGDDARPGPSEPVAGTSAAGIGGAGAGGGGAGSGGAGGSAGGAGSGVGGAGGSEVPHCVDPAGAFGFPSTASCQSPQLEAMQSAGLGEGRAFYYSVESRTLPKPMIAGSPYAFSIEVTRLGELPIHVELWGAGSECGTDLERLDGQSTLGGVVCSTMHPTVAHTHLIIVLRTNGAYGKGLSGVCPTGTCQGTTGITEEWPGNLEPFCNPDLPAECEVCLGQDGCDAPTYTDHGDGTVSSSCCGLTWMQALLPDPLEYEAAVDACWLSRFAGVGWRLPTLGEARSLLVPTASPMIDLVAFPGATELDAIWTSTDSRFFDRRETLSFQTGMNNSTDPTFSFRVLCVR